MLRVFFDHEGIVHHEYTPDGQTLTRCTTSKLSVGCVVRCSTMDLHCGSEVTGSCTTTMPLHICPALSGTSWLNIRHGGDTMKHGDSAVGYSKQSVPKVLRTATSQVGQFVFPSPWLETFRSGHVQHLPTYGTNITHRLKYLCDILTHFYSILILNCNHIYRTWSLFN